MRMELQLFSDDDLADVLAEVNDENNRVEGDANPEMEASQRRYDEIIKKHKKE